MTSTSVRRVGATLVALVLVLAPGVSRAAPAFPYWPANAGPKTVTPLANGAAFRKAMRTVTARARKAGWVRIEWGQLRDGGSVNMTFARKEPDLRVVRVFFKWHMGTGTGELAYGTGTRKPSTRVHGFPVCEGPALAGAVIPGRADQKHVVVAYCPGGGYGGGTGIPANEFPRLYGWKPVGSAAHGTVYERGGVFVEADSNIDSTVSRVRNIVRFDGRHDPRGGRR